MKTMLAALLAVSVSSSAMAQNQAKAEPVNYIVDTEATKVEWVGKKVAGPHNGFVKVKQGNVQVKDNVIVSGKIVIDMTSITNTDLTDAEYNKKLVEHLKSKDFFDVASHPEARLTILSSKKTAKGLDVVAELTIKDMSQPLTFTATDVKTTGNTFTAKSTISVDRTKYGVVYNAGKGDQSVMKKLGDKLIYDEFTLNVTLSAKK